MTPREKKALRNIQAAALKAVKERALHFGSFPEPPFYNPLVAWEWEASRDAYLKAAKDYARAVAHARAVSKKGGRRG